MSDAQTDRLRLAALVGVVMVAFAANSVLARMALQDGATGPGPFTALRIAAGAAALGLWALAREGAAALRAGAAPASAAALFVYAAAFSFAYLGVDAGLGALLLFGAVQITMFAGALAQGERPGPARWLGSAAALGGLAVLAAPGASAPPAWAAALMALSGAAWGLFSLMGRRGGAATPRMAAAFLLAAPLGLALWALAPGPLTAQGAALAALSGAVTSGAGYALWYAVLPRLAASLAAVAQLTVPLIALAGGVALLGEPATWRFALASALILGGLCAATLLGGPAVTPRR